MCKHCYNIATQMMFHYLPLSKNSRPKCMKTNTPSVHGIFNIINIYLLYYKMNATRYDFKITPNMKKNLIFIAFIFTDYITSDSIYSSLYCTN